jgi:hypothetical protein
MIVAGNGASGLGAEENVSRQKQFDPSVMDGLSSSKVTGMILSTSMYVLANTAISRIP